MSAKQHHAIDVLGYLKIPKHVTLPDFNSENTGRIIYVEDEKCFYKAGNGRWEKWGERSSHYFSMESPSASWGIQHDLDSPFNFINVYDYDGNQIYPRNVFVEDGNKLKIEFSTPVSGAAFIVPCDQHEADFTQWSYDSTSPVTSASEPTKYYGISMYGPFYNEKVDSLPEWFPIFEGRMVYNKENGKLYYSDENSWRESAGLQEIRVSQTAHGFVVGNLIRVTDVVGSAQYLLSDGSEVATADVFGIVSKVINDDTFEYVSQLGSQIEFTEAEWDAIISDKSNINPGLEISRIYFLSEESGKISEENATVNKPVIFAISPTKAFFMPLRGLYSTQGGDGVSAYIADINDIENVSVDTAETGNVLQYQSGSWVNAQVGWNFKNITLTPTLNTATLNPNEYALVKAPSAGSGYVYLPPDDMVSEHQRVAIIDEENSFGSNLVSVSGSNLEGGAMEIALSSSRYHELIFTTTLGWIKVI